MFVNVINFLGDLCNLATVTELLRRDVAGIVFAKGPIRPVRVSVGAIQLVLV